MGPSSTGQRRTYTTDWLMTDCLALGNFPQFNFGWRRLGGSTCSHPSCAMGWVPCSIAAMLTPAGLVPNLDKSYRKLGSPCQDWELEKCYFSAKMPLCAPWLLKVTLTGNMQFFPARNISGGMGCPGKWWSHHPWKLKKQLDVALSAVVYLTIQCQCAVVSDQWSWRSQLSWRSFSTQWFSDSVV